MPLATMNFFSGARNPVTVETGSSLGAKNSPYPLTTLRFVRKPKEISGSLTSVPS
ncbi:hypothetical protein [Streptomyces sp. NPDC017868]|uniref:hypothetical protein n=1 Tax=Streptomyces sp. NPDC017868 TaxID=3365014 RepID=UPI0037BC2CE3